MRKPKGFGGALMTEPPSLELTPELLKEIWDAASKSFVAAYPNYKNEGLFWTPNVIRADICERIVAGFRERLSP